MAAIRVPRTPMHEAALSTIDEPGVAATPRQRVGQHQRPSASAATTVRGVSGWRRYWSLVASVVVHLVGMLVLGATPAQAGTLAVTSLEDSGPGTVREALSLAAAQPGDDTIQFSVAGTIRLASTLTIASNVTLQGPGADRLALDGQNSVRVLQVSRGVTATISGLTVQNGRSNPGGGGIFNDGGTLTVTNSTLRNNVVDGADGGGLLNVGATVTVINSTLSGNQAVGQAFPIPHGSITIGGNGGGIFNIGGTVTVTNSTLSGNQAVGAPPGMFGSPGGSGGAIESNAGTLVVTNSTLSGNSATTRGGGISNLGAAVTMTNSTLIGNAASSGGSIESTVGTTRLRNSIVALSSTGGNCGTAGGGSVVSLGNNVSDTTACFAGTSQGDIVAAPTTLLFGSLANNGGPTETHALLPGSPAIDGVTFNPTLCPGTYDPGVTVTTDQRGLPRRPTSTSPRCDVGAFEVESNASPTISTIGPQATSEDTVITAIAFTVADPETPAGSLTVSGTSSNPALVPSANIVLGGSGADRTVTITPAVNEWGVAEITLTVSDGSEAVNRTFTLTVTAVNDPPVNTVPAAQTVRQNASLAFSSGNGNLISLADLDAGTSPVQLALSATNGTLSLNGTNGLTVVSGATGTGALTVSGPLVNLNTATNGLTFTPTAGFSGAAALQITTSDLGNSGTGGPRTDTDTIAITVTPFHSPPTISPIADQTTDASGSTPTVPFTVGSSVVPAERLVVTATSSDQRLVPNPAIQLTGAGTARAINVTGAAGQAGTATIDVSVSDGTATARTTFQVTVVQATGAPPSTSPPPTAPAAGPCAPRPPIRMTTTPDAGRLKVTLVAPPLNGQTNNRLIEIQFGAFENGTVAINRQPIDKNTTYTVPTPANTQGVEVIVTRTTPGQAMMIPLTVFDECGAWPTFIGSGAGAGF